MRPPQMNHEPLVEMDLGRPEVGPPPPRRPPQADEAGPGPVPKLARRSFWVRLLYVLVALNLVSLVLVGYALWKQKESLPWAGGGASRVSQQIGGAAESRLEALDKRLKALETRLERLEKKPEPSPRTGQQK